jgi:glycosyltransferase involved in cell wall biosynthesis
MGRVRVAYTLEQCWHRVPGGTAVSAIEVARAMPDVRPDVQLLGVSGRHGDDPVVDLDLSIDVAGLPGRGALLYESMLRLRQPRVERAWPECSAVHCTTIIPFATSRPMVTTVHDLAFLRHPEFFTRRGNDVFRRSLAAVRRRAALVLCSSSATLADCAEAGIPLSRLRLVPLGVRATTIPDDGVEQARVRLGLPSEYLLFVGTVEPRKNLGRLVAALARRPDLPPLVVAGAQGWGDGQPAVSTGGTVQWLGHVDDLLLPALYCGASAFVYPSLWEGFGLPVLEAMAQGTPVVTSAGVSTEEVVGGAAVLVDPTDEASILDGIDRALRDAASLRVLGLARAAEMTWQRAAALTATAYDEVTG